MYPADGRKVPDCYTDPPELHDELTAELGTFPLFTLLGAERRPALVAVDLPGRRSRSWPTSTPT